MDNLTGKKIRGPQLHLAEIKYDKYDESCILGNGSYGTVYKGYCRETQVAIKKLVSVEKKVFKEIQAEITAMRDNAHPNIITYLGVCAEKKGEILIVMDYCPGGDLDELLHEKKNEYLSLYERMDMARQIASGLAWLHGTGYMHRDLKPANIFLDGERRIKIGDLGFAVKTSHKKTNFKGSALWMAPEKLEKREESKKSDVYSFAIIMWELLTREEPFSNHEDLDEFTEAICEQHERPPIPSYCPESIRTIIVKCWQFDPAQRLDFEQICQNFDTILVDAAIKDKNGRQFWKDHFDTNPAVPFPQFIKSFYNYCKYVPKDDKDMAKTYIFAALADTKGGMITTEDFSHLLKWFGPLKANAKVIKRITDMFTKNYFWGRLDSAEAAKYISNSKDGTFLVRFSTTKGFDGCFAVSRMKKGKVGHFRIQYSPKKQAFEYGTGTSFPTLDEALAYDGHCKHPLLEVGKAPRFLDPDVVDSVNHYQDFGGVVGRDDNE